MGSTNLGVLGNCRRCSVPTWPTTTGANQERHGGWRLCAAPGPRWSEWGEPIWPNKSLAELLKLGFRDQLIDSPEHDVVQTLEDGMQRGAGAGATLP